MKYYLVKLLINTAGQDAPSIDPYDKFEDVVVSYHQILAAYHNAEDVLYAVVEIVDEYGIVVGGNNGYREIVDHRQPEPAPEE